MDIPKQVIEAAKGRADCGGRLEVICNYESKEVFSYVYDEPVIIGPPEFYLWDGEKAETVQGDDALELLSKLPIE